MADDVRSRSKANGKDAGPGPMRAPSEAWHDSQPAVLPRPTYWPAAMALAVVLLFWGLVTSLILSATGLLLGVIVLAGWIGELLHEFRQDQHGRE